MVFLTLETHQVCMPKLALEISKLSVEKKVIQIITVTWELVFHSLESPYNHTPKMMLPALWTSCLKDSHTNFQSNIGIGIAYFGDISRLYAKNDAASYTNQLFEI
jgi:hypothetical protein